MNYTLFISDLHLHEQTPQLTTAFFTFLEEATQADALYILGDLFDSWIGDDYHTAFTDKIIGVLRNITRKIPVYFIHGNRDFLIGQQFFHATGVTPLTEICVIQLYGISILLMHGDSLCTLDTAHQRYRKIAMNPRYQKIFLAMPLWFRRMIAHWMRKNSSRKNRALHNAVMDVTPIAVTQALQQYPAKWLIHGHTHRPAIHELDTQTGKKRIVLGDWHDHSSVLKINKDGTFTLQSFPIAP